jgi:glycosyltransferase involved in cell wall biosynthesis
MPAEPLLELDRLARPGRAARIYLNGRFLTQPVTGVQRFARELISALSDCADSEISESIEILAPPGVGMATYAGFRVRTVGRFSGHLWEQLELPWHARRGWLVSLCNTAPLLKRQQLVVIHDAAVFAVPAAYTWAFRTWYRVLFLLMSRMVRLRFTVSNFSRRELATYLRLAPNMLGLLSEGGEHVLREVADVSVLKRHHLTARPFALAVSSTSPHKNFAMAVRAFELLSDLDCDLVVAGGANPRVFAGASGLGENVKHLGYVTDAELRALYEGALCLIYPSVYEGFGLPPLEAMVCGCPVIASNAASLPEVCGAAALYCDAQDPACIAAAVRALAADPALREQLRGRARQRAAEYGWKNGAQRLLQAFGPALAAWPQPRDPGA